ncbi:hypothetical protein GCM10009836_54580 [Pseudonocardia ailaonensis]|uniref:CBS domain-containing protein n=1 Tax=Pseudonocardia ailaonensis TaxID=367279 RepID=A0ABN2NHP3_9PSEU
MTVGLFGDDSGRDRSRYLLDGRRVVLKDLIESSLLAPGDRLTFSRPNLGEKYHAGVLPSGRIELDDGQAFATPSKAAAAAAGVRAMDGWHAWTVDGTNRTLASLRTDLLAKVVGDRGTDEPDPTSTRYEILRSAREQADRGNPAEMTVRELLRWWDASERGYDIDERIVADLENHGLATSPDFRRVNLDSQVTLRPGSQPVDSPRETGVGEPTTADQVSGPLTGSLEQVDIGLTLGNLPSAMGELVSITPQATFEEAITRMALDDYSQLPVMVKGRNLRGAVTWQSIAQTRLAKAEATLGDAIVPTLPERYDRPLVEVLPRLVEEGFVFVEDDQRLVSGIVTTADVVNLYGELALPFLLVGELDRRLRRIVSKLPFQQVCSVCDPAGSRLRTPDDLTMGDYERTLESKEIWDTLEWPLDRVVLIQRLGRLRRIRNDITHFNPDMRQSNVVADLRNFLNLLRRHDD